jgi:putative membrane protein insertion efficiency factor
MKYVLIWLIKGYQKIPGPWHSYCKFHPSCSNYALGVLNEFGAFKGTLLTIKRICKCNPWNKGGYDPIPQRNKNKHS